MDRRSQLMALAVAFVVAAGLLPVTAQAAETCLANPSGAARSGKHWYYQTNLETQQKCWFIGARKTALGKAMLQTSFDSADQDQLAGHAVATTCAAAPIGHTPRGKRWSYQMNPITGQKCWRLNNRISRSAKAARMQPPAWVQLAAAGEPSTALPRPIADAQASLQESAPENANDAVTRPAAPHETESSASAKSKAAPREESSIPTFEARWTNDFKTAPADFSQPGRPDSPGIDQPAVAGAGTVSFKSAEWILAAGPPLIDVLVAFVATLGSVLILLGFLDWSFLFRGSALSAPEPRSPLRLPKLESDLDLIPNHNVGGSPASALRRDRDDMLTFFAPMAAATAVGTASRFLTETV